MTDKTAQPELNATEAPDVSRELSDSLLRKLGSMNVGETIALRRQDSDTGAEAGSIEVMAVPYGWIFYNYTANGITSTFVPYPSPAARHQASESTRLFMPN